MKDLLTLSDLRALQLPEPLPLVEGILHQGETILVVGRPKMGKSRLVQQLTIFLSRGEPFLGHRVPEPRKVLLVDLENRPAGVKRHACRTQRC
jgi:RecA-family ATPase